MKKCDSYHLQPKTKYAYHPLSGRPIAYDIEVGVCWGTKECDECDCGGNETKCDFYPHVREKAKKETKEVITNGGYIRSKDNKELAKFLMSNWFIEELCQCCEGEYDKCGDLKFCESKIYKWLLKTKK